MNQEQRRQSERKLSDTSFDTIVSESAGPEARPSLATVSYLEGSFSARRLSAESQSIRRLAVGKQDIFDCNREDLKREKSQATLYEDFRADCDLDDNSTMSTGTKTAYMMVCIGLVLGFVASGFMIYQKDLMSEYILSLVKVSLLNTPQERIPKSYKIFAPNKNPHVPTDVQVFLDLEGTESSFIASALRQCLGLHEKRVSRRSLTRQEDKEKKKENKIDFVTTDSLCNFSRNFNKTKTARLFMLVRHPNARTMKSFQEKQNSTGRNYDERTVGLKFDEFINSNLIDTDHLTRSLLCKRQDEVLSEEDFEVAQYFMDNYVVYGVYHHYRSAFYKFLDVFGWELNEVSGRCVRDVFQERRHHLQNEPIVSSSQALNNVNQFDLKLYAHALSDSMN